MSVTAHLARLEELLRHNPATPAPVLRADSPQQLHDFKDELRAFDQARLELNLATPQQVQRENAAVSIDRRTARRVIRYEQ
jgi:hypothetical protein